MEKLNRTFLMELGKALMKADHRAVAERFAAGLLWCLSEADYAKLQREGVVKRVPQPGE